MKWKVENSWFSAFIQIIELLKFFINYALRIFYVKIILKIGVSEKKNVIVF